MLVCVCGYAQIYFYSWQYTECFLCRCFNYDSLGWILLLSFFFPRALSLYIPQLPSLFKYKWRALKKKLSSKCRSPCCISHSESMSHQPHTCWKCVPRIIGACVSFPRLQVIIGLSGLHVAWCSTGSERCLWQQKRVQILKAALEGLAHSTCWAVSSWTVIFILDPLIYSPVVESLWSAFFTGASF